MSRLCRLKSYKTIGDDGVWAYEEITSLRDQLAASQAHIKVLREALETCEWVDSINGGEYIYDEPLVKAALALPHDDSALQAAILSERESCAAACSTVYYQHIGEQFGEVRYGIQACAAAIRARGDSK